MRMRLASIYNLNQLQDSQPNTTTLPINVHPEQELDCNRRPGAHAHVAVPAIPGPAWQRPQSDFNFSRAELGPPVEAI